MKTLKLIAVGIILLVSSSIQAQVSVSLNIGTAPSWGPTGYANVDYYYLPDVQAYYDIRASQFIYFGQGRWVRSRYLPRQYRNYDLNRGYKVVLNDYHGNRPYANFHNDRRTYYKGYRGGNQRTIVQRQDNHRYSNDRNAVNHRKYDTRRYSENRKSSNNHGKYDNHRNNDHGNKRENKGHGKH
ncbi:hypothetical protein [Flavobacterium frigoris]|uniref:Uncharacterized protein n=1 Tax=Flavobacterium frigoris (strain PS1) TaxID=1086011 RepID=H7FVR6_FLAFP|nr:hypothetical protein [Flavobacterium frigoris]EIA07397.1 hypothetical protein HJ01_03200 [Flavobacterium frigoris PS1]